GRDVRSRRDGVDRHAGGRARADRGAPRAGARRRAVRRRRTPARGAGRREQHVSAADDLDRVAVRALDEVRAGMRLGLGTGRAAEAFIRRLGERARAGLDVVGVATSRRSEALAAEVGVRTGTVGDLSPLDVAFDGADEVAPDLSAMKGLGGAHLRERVVAAEAARFVLLVTPEKLVARLGERAPVPVEVAAFAVE